MNLLLIALAAMLGVVQAQPQQTSASIEGVVVKLGTGEPLANASVQLNVEGSNEARSQSRRTTRSGSNGRFIFDLVPAGEYRLIATYEGEFVPAEYGQRSPTGQGIPFEITAGQRMTGIQLAMAPTGAISGRVYDADGEPLGKAQVFALRASYNNGRRVLAIVQSVESDDRGEYRLYWLAPGRYYVGVLHDIPENPLNMSPVRVTPPTRFGTYQQGASPVIHRRKSKTGEVMEEMFLPVYYPNALDINAAAGVSVAAGTTSGGVDIATGAGRITPRHIRGRVFNGANGQPVEGANLEAMPRTASPFFAVSSARSAADGTFDIPGVAPGSYQIVASAYSSTRALDGIAPVDIADKDAQNIPVVMTSGFTLSGRFVMESHNTQASFPLTSFIRYSEFLNATAAIIGHDLKPANADGSFTIERIPPGDFRVALQRLPLDGYVKSMRMGSADVLNDGLHITGPPDTVLEVVIGANAGRIEGSVVNSRSEPLANRTVVLVPDVRLRQRSDLYKVVSTNSVGRFRMQGIAPGEYKLFAWENVETGAWQDPNFIQAYENAGRLLRINEGSSENLQLPVIP